MNKKILTIGLGVIFVGLLIGVWLLFFYNPNGIISEDIRDILPFGQGGNDISAPADSDEPEEIQPTESDNDLPSFFRLSDVPVSGAIGFLKNNSTIIRYADRATGHIYDINPRTLEKTKISNNTLPKIYEALFKKDGSGVVYRSLKNDSDEIITTSIDLIPPKGTSTDALYSIKSYILRGDIRDITIGNEGKLLYNLKDTKSVVVSDFSGANAQTLLTMNFYDWDFNWTSKNATMLTKPSSYADGYLYNLNTSTGNLTKITGPIPGLTALLNPDATRLIYTSSVNGVATYATKLSSGDFLEIVPATLADKCVWSKKNVSVFYCGAPNMGWGRGEPDQWYRGITHYNNTIWKFDMDTAVSTMMLNPSNDFKVDIDVINPFLTPDEDYLIFTNKDDLSLWALKLVE